MKTKDKHNIEKDKSKQSHENQNIYDFNPSQFVEEDIDKKKEEDEKENSKKKQKEK
jgi:hypothetical protein